MNVGEQNTQQIGKNPSNQPIQIQENPKVNYWMISTIIFAALFLAMAGMYLFGIQNEKILNQKQIDQQSQTDNLLSKPTLSPSYITAESKKWSSTQSWSTNDYTKTLFEFLKTKLSEDYIYLHFELVDPEKIATEPEKYRTVKFRLHYGSELAFTGNASRAVDDPSFISGIAWILDGTVKSYTGPLKEYEIKVSKNQALDILNKNGLKKVLVPGARKIDTLELWIYDYENEKADQVYWIGGVKNDESNDWFWVSALDGTLKKESKLGPI